jgi:hypothetical protein
MIFTLQPARLLAFLLGCTALLAAAHAGALFARHVLGIGYLFGLIDLFDLNGEQNLPTLFSSVLLLACSLALIVSGRLATRMRAAWYALGVVFALLAISETAVLHEPLLFVLKGNVSPRTAELAANMPLRFAEIWPALAVLGALIAAAGLAYLSSLDGRARGLFVLSGGLYVGGAVLIDQLTAAGGTGPGLVWWAEILSTSLEEIMELTGAAVFLYAMTDRLARLYPGIAVRLGAAVEGRD